MAIKLLPDLETQRRIADATEDIVNKLTSKGSGGGGVEPPVNKEVLDKLTDQNGKLLYNGQEISGGLDEEVVDTKFEDFAEDLADAIEDASLEPGEVPPVSRDLQVEDVIGDNAFEISDSDGNVVFGITEDGHIKTAAFDSSNIQPPDNPESPEGSVVIPNPSLNGSENDLIGLQINDIKYKIPVGTGGEVGDGLINSVGDIEKELNYIHTDYGVEMATNVNYYVDSDVMVCKVMLTSLSGSILKLLTTTTIGVPRGSGYFVNFSTGKIGFYNGRSNNTQTIAYQRDCALTFVAGHQYVIEAIKREKRHYLKITDAYTLETDIYSVYPANSNELGEHWGKRSYEVAGSVTVQSFKNYSLEPYKCRLLVIGDSFVESFGTYPNRYVDIMKRLLNGSCAISGFGGATTEQVRTFYNDYCKTIFKPDYVLIAAGTNNNNYSTWLTAQQGLISDIKSAGSIPVLVTITRRLDNNNLSFMRQTNNWIRNTSGELYMDFNIITTLNYDGETQNTEMFSTDRVHPLASTHPLMVKRALLDVPEIFNLTGNYVKNRKELGGI